MNRSSNPGSVRYKSVTERGGEDRIAVVDREPQRAEAATRPRAAFDCRARSIPARTTAVFVAQHEQLHVDRSEPTKHRQQAEQAPHQPVEQRQTPFLIMPELKLLASRA
jgi:hypothetical protein